MKSKVLAVNIPAQRSALLGAKLKAIAPSYFLETIDSIPFIEKIENSAEPKEWNTWKVILVGIEGADSILIKQTQKISNTLSKRLVYLILDETFTEFDSLPTSNFLPFTADTNITPLFIKGLLFKANQKKKASVSLENLAKVCHELRSPLNVILGSVENLDQNIDLHSRQEHSRALKASSQMLLSLVENVLELSHLNNESFELKKSSFNLQNLLMELDNLCAPLASQKNLELSFDSDFGSDFSAKSDELRIKQILINLLYNAFKFTNKGSIEVVVGKNHIREKPGNILFAVRDSGKGIHPNDLEAIFKPFTQSGNNLDNTPGKKKSEKGSGLGLAVCYELVKQMGGDIWVESVLGVGSQFAFTLNLEFESDDIGAENTLLNREELTLLIVDDDLEMAETIATVFESKGVKCFMAHNAETAMKYIESESIDAISTDYNMPGIDGADFVFKLRKQHIDIPLVILSGVLDGKLKKILELAHVSVFSKPIDVKNSYFPIVYKYLKIGSKLREERNILLELLQLGKLRVLVVDDEPGQLICYQGFLKRTQFEVFCASSIGQAFELFQKINFDLMISDINLPDGNGIDLVKSVRAFEDERNALSTQIIIISGTDDSKILRDSIKAGANLTLFKPVNKIDFWKSILKTSAKKSQRYLKQSDEAESGIDLKFIEDLKELSKAHPEENLIENQLEAYFKRSEKYIDLLTKAIKAKDKEKSIHAAHKLTSVSGFVGALKASQISRKIELGASSENFELCEDLIKTLKKEQHTNKIELKEIEENWQKEKGTSNLFKIA